MAAAVQHEVLQNLDWDEDKFKQIIGCMYVEGNATASSQQAAREKYVRKVCNCNPTC